MYCNASELSTRKESIEVEQYDFDAKILIGAITNAVIGIVNVTSYSVIDDEYTAHVLEPGSYHAIWLIRLCRNTNRSCWSESEGRESKVI